MSGLQLQDQLSGLLQPPHLLFFKASSMAKIHPNEWTLTTAWSSDNYMSSKRETFTVWMKSLVFHGNGCTVFDSKGKLVYRIDNYEQRSNDEVYLMDLEGNILFSLIRRRVGFSKYWDGYKWSGSKLTKPKRPSFQVKKKSNAFSSEVICDVCLGSDQTKAYRLVGFAGKLAFTIRDYQDRLVAEVQQKHLPSGYGLGEDVLSLVVEPQVDHSLVMALVSVYGLMTNYI